jgi:hypothetical protein
MMIFSILNFKDMLDIIDIISIEKGPQITKIMSFFSTISCDKATPLFPLEGEYLKNQSIRKSIKEFLNMEGKQLIQR